MPSGAFDECKFRSSAVCASQFIQAEPASRLGLTQALGLTQISKAKERSMFFSRLLLASFLFLASSPVLASKELNISRDGSADPSTTAIVVTERQAGGGVSMTVTSLRHITDLSLPADKQKSVKLFSAWSALLGKYPRVSPGTYSLHVGCEVGGMVNVKQVHNVTIEAKSGKAYVVGCDGVGARAQSPSVREVDQDALTH
jgi:hypothetical protein